MNLEAMVKGWEFSAVPIEPNGWAARTDGARSYWVTIGTGFAQWEGPYSVGSGIPIRWAIGELDAGRRFSFGKARDIRALGAFGSGYARSIHGRELGDRIADLYRPGIVDVVGALFADASGFEPFADLRSWIDDTGMEFDHPADAVEAFEGCRRAAAFLRTAFGDAYDRAAELAGEL